MINFFRTVIAAFGWKNQLQKTTEELGELQAEIFKCLKFKNLSEVSGNLRQCVLEEVIDCYIMLQQIILIFGFTEEELERWQDKKINKLQGYLLKNLQERNDDK